MTTAAPAKPGAALAVRRKTVRDLVLSQQAQLAAALPAHVSADRMLRTFFTELSKTPALYECTPLSLLGALIQSAQLGLEFGVLGHAYLVPFRNRRRGTKEVQLIPGYKGLLKLARNSGELSTITAHTVLAGDEFKYNYGLEPRLHHVPSERPVVEAVGEGQEVVRPITHFYAAARLRDGGHQFEVMTRAEVEAHRDRYASDRREDSAWATNFPEMGLKTVLRRLCRLLPASVELQRALTLDAQARHGETQDLVKLIDGAALGGDWAAAAAEEAGETGAGGEPGSGEDLEGELAALRAKVLEAEAGLAGRDLQMVRRQHLRVAELEAVRDPALLSDYLVALPNVPRAGARPGPATGSQSAQDGRRVGSRAEDPSTGRESDPGA